MENELYEEAVKPPSQGMENALYETAQGEEALYESSGPLVPRTSVLNPLYDSGADTQPAELVYMDSGDLREPLHEEYTDITGFIAAEPLPENEIDYDGFEEEAQMAMDGDGGGYLEVGAEDGFDDEEDE